MSQSASPLSARILLLDSTSYMSGNLVDNAAPRFSLNTSISTSGPVTTISSHTLSTASDPLVSSEVGVVEWKSPAMGRLKTIVKTKGQNRTLGALMKSTSFGSMRHFGMGNVDVKWVETDGTWQCQSVNETGRVLAVLHSRIATRGTRIEVSSHGNDHMDNIVLTALFVLHGEQDWKAFQNKPTVVHSPYSFYQPRNQIYIAPSPHVSVLTLTLSTASFLDGLLAVGGQLMYAMKTTANRTVVSKYTWEETPRLEEFASIEWLGNGMFGKLKSVITYAGQRRCLEDFLFSSFLGNRLRRFGMPDFLPWLQWVERPPSWQCVSHPGKQPLAILERRFLSAGTRLDITQEGLQYLDPLVLTAILVAVGPLDWRRERPAAPGSNSSNAVARRALRPQAGGRSYSAQNVLSITPPGLTNIRSMSEMRVSRLSTESEVPEYSPPPRGLVLNYDEYYDSVTPAMSTMPSRANSPPPMAGHSTDHGLPPPYYHP